MKLLYITPLIDKQRLKDRSLCYKVEGMLKAFSEVGYECSWIHFDGKQLMKDNDVIGHYPSMWLFGLKGYKDIYNALSNEVYDIIYIRYACSDPSFIHFLKLIHRNMRSKVILEFATYPYDQEWKGDTLLKKVAILLDRLYRKRLKNYIDCAVTFTDYPSIFGIPSVVIQNGIDIDSIVYTGMNNDKVQINLIGVAHLEFWQGYDRVIEGLADYYKNGGEKKVHFHIVGDGAEREKLELLARKRGLKEHVTFHGFKMGIELTEIYKGCHIGVGSLGMFRKGLESGAALKIREYAARGLTLILGYDDIGLSGNEPFVKTVPNDSTPVNIKDVLSYFSTSTVSSHDIRLFALESFGWNLQIDQIINAMKAV